jgi:hypothetical protein
LDHGGHLDGFGTGARDQGHRHRQLRHKNNR